MGLLGHRVVLFLIFWRTYIPFTTIAVPIYISTNRSQGSLFSTSSPALLSCLFDNCYLKCEVVSVAWFAFPWYLRTLSTFSCSCWPFVHLLWKNSYSGPYVNFLIGFFCCWVVQFPYIFWILTLHQILTCKYFLPLCGLPFNFNGSFCCAEACVVVSLVLTFFAGAFGIILKIPLSRPMIRSFSVCFLLAVLWLRSYI